MRRRTFHTVTLGCKLNQFDSAAIAGELTRRGFSADPDPASAEIVVLNTCTVTHKADAEARKLIRSIRRGNPACRLVVTGCYAELEPDTVRELDEVDHVMGNRDKPRLAAMLDEWGVGSADPDDSRGPVPFGDRGCDAGDPSAALHFGDRSRAFLKIQEGCRLSCSYCIIPRVRGASRSVAPEAVARTLRSLIDSGYREVVLTGVNTGDYGRDLDGGQDLANLLKELLAACGPNRIRLNSLEPRTVTDEIVELMAGDPRLAPHLQVPLQSGSPTILRRMRRNYRRSAYLDRLTRLRSAVPSIGLGADVIVGFPGETESLFRETYDFIAESPLNYLHVFSWSPRPGTPAADLADRVAGGTIRERSARLRALANRLGFLFRKRFEGRNLDAVVLGSRRADGRMRALTGNFIEVSLDPETARRGEVVEVELQRVTPTETHARVVGAPDWARLEAPAACS